MSTRTSDLDDPLDGFSGLMLFPRTLATVRIAPQPYDLNDLQHASNFLRSVPLQSPNELLEQGKVIVHSSSGNSNCEISSFVTSKDQNNVAAAKDIDNPQERRPGLGRKRARFSLKPKSSQPTVKLEPSFDIDKLKDPEEFFLAYEKFENAKREIEKQTGGVTDLNKLNPSMAPRPRRQGILGRRSVKYKHHYSNDISSQETFENEKQETTKPIVASEGTFEENILSDNNYNVQQETADASVALQEMELADAELQESELVGSVTKKEKRVSELLDELVTGEDEELDEDRAVTLLQEQLQIKPIVLGKLCIPDLHVARRIDLKASGVDVPKHRNPLSDIQNLVKGMSSRTPKKRKSAESSVSCLASPTPPRSPLGSIIALKKHLQSNLSLDAFSAHDIDQSLARNASPFANTGKQIDEVNMEKELSISSKLKSPMVEGNGLADVTTSLPVVDKGDATCSSDKTVHDNLSRLDSGVGVGPSVFLADVVDSVGVSCLDNKVLSKTSGRPDANTSVQINEQTELNEKVKDVLEAVDSVLHGLNLEDSTAEKLNSTRDEFDQTSRDVVEDHAIDGPSKTVDAGLEGVQQHNEVDYVQPDLNMENSTAENLNSTQTELDKTSHGVVEDHAIGGTSKTADAGPKGLQQHNEVNFVQPDLNMEDCTAEKLNSTQTELDQTHGDVVEDHSIDGPAKTADTGSQGPHHNEVNSVQPDLNMEDSPAKKLNSTQTVLDQTSRDVVEDRTIDVPARTSDAGPQQCIEEVQRSTREPSDKQGKTISRARRKGKCEIATRRQSLAASGTSWESGVRRSTRIRSRPLEYWKGERFLYGRVHESLTTVIGIKYESPGNADGKPGIKVKSFVSDKYKDLVELAARF